MTFAPDAFSVRDLQELAAPFRQVSTCSCSPLRKKARAARPLQKKKRLPCWLCKGAFKVSSGGVQQHRSNSGTDFDTSEIASPEQQGMPQHVRQPTEEGPTGWFRATVADRNLIYQISRSSGSIVHIRSCGIYTISRVGPNKGLLRAFEEYLRQLGKASMPWNGEVSSDQAALDPVPSGVRNIGQPIPKGTCWYMVDTEALKWFLCP